MDNRLFSSHSEVCSVDKDIRVEVLDWSGSGRPLVLLAGLGNTAHVFDKFAPKLTAKYHLYGITRRGFGSSSTPLPNSENYSSDRLADDVIAVIDSLHLKQTVVVGHSIAGEDLSSIGSPSPEKVAGLIYVDAGYPYALYDFARGDLLLDSLDMQNKMAHLTSGPISNDQKQLIQGLLLDLPRFEKDLREQLDNLEAMPSLFASPTLFRFSSPAAAAIVAGTLFSLFMEFQCRVIVQRGYTLLWLACGKHSAPSRTPFRSATKTVRLPTGIAVTFRPECCSESQRNGVQLQTGIVFSFDRIPQ